MAIAVAASMALAGTALADGDREVVTFFSQDAGNGAVEALIEAYEAAQDKYEINWVVAPKDTTEVKTMLNTALAAGSTEYDVVRIDTVWTGDMAGAGYLDALDQNLMADGLSPANFKKTKPITASRFFSVVPTPRRATRQFQSTVSKDTSTSFFRFAALAIVLILLIFYRFCFVGGLARMNPRINF